ncbi:hypothetical protein BGZ47_003904, partial [Haplosporangium gracile]
MWAVLEHSVLPDDQFLTTYLHFFPEQVHAVRPPLSAAVISRRFAAIDNHVMEMKRRAADLDQEGFEEFKKDCDRQTSKRKRVKILSYQAVDDNAFSEGGSECGEAQSDGYTPSEGSDDSSEDMEVHDDLTVYSRCGYRIRTKPVRDGGSIDEGSSREGYSDERSGSEGSIGEDK